MALFGKKTEPKPEPRAPEPEVMPQLAPLAKKAYGIDDAIQLMRTLPLNQNLDLVLLVVKNTLASLNVDLAHVIEHRNEVAALKSQVDLLLARIGETDERIQAIDARRKLVDEVQTKANAIVHLLDDVRINLEMLGEQKAVVDHVAEKAAQLEFMVQEARNTTRTLQKERELAERIEKSIKGMRSKPAKDKEDVRTA